MPVDERRTPHFGGRKYPAFCSVCGRWRPCVAVDDMSDDRKDAILVCIACVGDIIEIAWDRKRLGREDK